MDPPPDGGPPKEWGDLESRDDTLPRNAIDPGGYLAPGARRGRLYSGVRPLDRFLGGLPPGEVTVLRGLHHAPTLLARLLVMAVLDMDEDVVFVDGGNVADPYSLSAACRRLRVRPAEVLPRVHMARAFTSFQMSSILEDALPLALEEHDPGVLAVSCVDELYHDDNMDRDQATVLLGRALDRVRALTVGAGLVTVLADLRPQPRRGRGRDRYAALLDARAHRVVGLERRSRRTLRLRRADGATAVLASPPPGQLTLDEFQLGGISTGTTGGTTGGTPAVTSTVNRPGGWPVG